MPAVELGLPLWPRRSSSAYLAWPKVTDLFPARFSGIKPARDEFLVDIDRAALDERIREYFDRQVSDEAMARVSAVAMKDTARFNAAEVRAVLRKRGLNEKGFVRYCYRPFDHRWLYWELETELLDRRREDYHPQFFVGNRFMAVVDRPRRGYDGPLVATLPCSYHINELSARLLPERLKPADGGDLFSAGTGSVENLAAKTLEYGGSLAKPATEQLVFPHAIAILHAPAYAGENDGALSQDEPRIPLPAKHKQLAASAALGEELARLLDPETPAPGVSTGTIRPELKVLGVLTRTDGKQVNPKVGHLDITAGWGHAGKGGVTMPARGKSVEREYTKDEVAALTHGGAEWRSLLGQTTRDIYLNDHAYWANVPERVWEYTLGGYQVIKKWLSYRVRELLGRGLTVEEARYVGEMVRRIAAILLLGPALDANYAAVKADTWPWPGGTA